MITKRAASLGIEIRHLRLGLIDKYYTVRSANYGLTIDFDNFEYSAQSAEQSEVLFLPFDVSNPPWVNPQGSDFTTREWNTTIECALLQWWDACDRNWLIAPGAQVLQDRKIYLLNLAGQIEPELTIPATHLGTRFPGLDIDNRFVGKALNAWQQVHKGRFFNTTELSAGQILALSQGGNNTPIMIQRYVPHKCELRIYFARGKFACVKVDSGTSELSDFRLLTTDTGSAEFYQECLPRDIMKGLIELCRRINVFYCCFDFIVDESSQLWLTDINPTGSWRYLSRDFDIDVTSFILDNLTGDR
ncbi:ATP-grasp domain-containing protein [Antrihabitans stalactiti]|uniref:ATP-grasp domain-containing protein n=1 Tax=Antrihabitans stalactiti TaxID=2584121 RepID=A0A848KPB2_9NOCA|nr:hypothetical protein [Antrihabitans stalactiti]NMN98462.1 hypothetical protein [Antrihabitans stalactiti]